MNVLTKKRRKGKRRKRSFVEGYFFGPVSILRTFSGKTKTRCSRTLLPSPRPWFVRWWWWWWSSNEVALCLFERLLEDIDEPPTAPAPPPPAPRFLIKCLFCMEMADADELNGDFSCMIFIPDVDVKLVDIDEELFPLDLYCWWLRTDVGRGLTETFINAVEERDAVRLLVVVVDRWLFFVGDCCGRVFRGRIDVSVSHVTEMVLNVAELERCNRFLYVLLVFPVLLLPEASLARATCSGTTWVIWLWNWWETADVELGFVVISNDSGCQWSGHETKLEKSCWCDNNEDDGCCSDSMIHRCRRQKN